MIKLVIDLPKRLFRCKVCGYYTLSSKSCPKCRGTVTNPHPAKFSIIDNIKKLGSFNGILLTIFITLLCILNIVNTRYFAGTDPWLHISIVKYITEVNYVPMNEYYGALGLHIFGAVFHFFSGLDLILLPKFYLFYTIPISSLIIYNLLRRIFKNKNLAIFGVFLLFSSFLVRY